MTLSVENYWPAEILFNTYVPRQNTADCMYKSVQHIVSAVHRITHTVLHVFIAHLLLCKPGTIFAVATKHGNHTLIQYGIGHHSDMQAAGKRACYLMLWCLLTGQRFPEFNLLSCEGCFHESRNGARCRFSDSRSQHKSTIPQCSEGKPEIFRPNFKHLSEMEQPDTIA